jgi:glycosyltransferase involved in cell wall biosynthesis
MACGCPVAASNTTALPEVCGDAARLFDPTSPEAIAAAVADVLDAPGEYVRRGLERARLFTWNACARGHDAAYREVAVAPG